MDKLEKRRRLLFRRLRELHWKILRAIEAKDESIRDLIVDFRATAQAIYRFTTGEPLQVPPEPLADVEELVAELCVCPHCGLNHYDPAAPQPFPSDVVGVVLCGRCKKDVNDIPPAAN